MSIVLTVCLIIGMVATPEPAGWHWSENPNLHNPFDGIGGGNYGCVGSWHKNNSILGEIALKRPVTLFELEVLADKVAKYNFPKEICDRHFPKTYIGTKYIAPTEEEWKEYGLTPPEPEKPIDWGAGTRETIPTIILE